MANRTGVSSSGRAKNRAFGAFVTVVGALAVTVGAYAHGGHRLRCTPAPAGLATCQSQETRWLSRVASEPVAIPGVREISARVTSRTVTETSETRRRRTRRMDDWALVFDSAYGETKVDGNRDHVDAAVGTLRVALDNPGRPAQAELSEWRFGVAAMALGAVVALIGLRIAI